MDCRPDLAFAYCHSLLTLKSSMQNRTPAEQDGIWLDEHNSLHKRHLLPVDLEVLPQALALIHPCFRQRRGTSFSQSLPIGADGDFYGGINDASPCEWAKVEGVPCTFEPFRRSTRCHADHVWPATLGGPSIRENRQLLCAYHNLTKGSSITHFAWTRVPSWLITVLSDMANLKS